MASRFIRKNLATINHLGYTILEDGKQLSKVIDGFEILVTDLSMRPALDLFYIYRVIVGIKIIEEEIIIDILAIDTGHFVPKMENIHKDILKTIDEYKTKTGKWHKAENH